MMTNDELKSLFTSALRNMDEQRASLGASIETDRHDFPLGAVVIARSPQSARMLRSAVAFLTSIEDELLEEDLPNN